ncbi:MAG: CPBP family intramembrane metalloprotease [Candidatus Cloacimonetes bacterium]|nr:CPBP family intramembrane metalloprotease [Candidatus Cloacimonadota bacterium]
MFRKPLFWIIFTIAVIAASIFCLQNFARIMSFINLDITMDRNEALQSAKNDSETWDVGPADSRQAVIFNENGFLQYYIELEAGGKEGYNEFLAEGKYQPYRWVVRHFLPQEEHQVYFIYTPAGELYGFQEIIPETEPGTNLSVEAAQAKGEAAAAQLGVNLTEYELVETSKNEVISGREDYEFVYERPELLKEARFRFTIGVSGDHVSRLEHSVKIPEAFSRRFQEMRSANNTIASGAQYGMLFLYGLLGIGLGSFFLLRTRYLLYRKALLWSFIVAFLGFLAGFNDLPLSWIWYDTAVTTQAHIMQSIMTNLLGFIQNFILLALSFIAAESLTRKAFPNHVRFWKTLTAPVAGSKRILGNTLAGYGLVAINLAYVLAFYLFTSKHLGWWNPAGLQVDPNFIAMPLPWLSVLSQALHAGFWEEALFRAVPLAGMVLIGRKLNKEKLFLVLGIIIQALIFSAGHANYAAQPAYARVVELIVPSLVFAFLYIRFGLYTGIILHFSFDAVLMAMYIWIMKAPGIWVNRILVIIGILLPLLIILYYRLKAGKWLEISTNYLNKHWLPAPPKPLKAPELICSSRSYNPRTLTWLIIAALIGTACWVAFTPFQADQPQMKLNRSRAVEIAKAVLEKQNIELSDGWRIDAELINSLSNSDKLVWQEAGKSVYHQAMGEYISEPVWQISFRTWKGDVADRAEAYRFRINTNGIVTTFRHTLPEDRAGMELTEDEARQLAVRSITDFYNMNDFTLNEVEAAPEKMPQRKDWNFTFKDTLNYQPDIGEYRYNVKINGDQVMVINRYTYVPEEWSRQERNRTRPVRLFSQFFNITFILLYFAIGILAVVSWSNHRFNISTFYFVLLVMIVSTLVLRLNQWQQTPAGFSTSQPWNNQVLQYVLGSVSNVLVLSFIFALLAGFLGSWQNKTINKLRVHNVILAALLFNGISALITLFKPDYMPSRPELNTLADYSPLLTVIFQAVSQWITSALLLIFAFHWLDKITANGQKRKFLTWLIFFIFVFILRQSVLVYASLADFTFLIILAASLALTLYFIFRQILVFDLSLIPVFLAVNASMQLLQNCFVNSWQGAVMANILAIIVINLLAWGWLTLLRKYRWQVHA